MTRWFTLKPADAGFFATAPHVFRYVKHFAAPPEQVWDSLQSDESLAAWGNSVGSLTWTSPRPFGVGTTREVSIGPATVREQFFEWTDNVGYSFFVTEASIPVFRRFAEDYRIEAEGAGTRFTWLVAVEPAGAFRLPVRALAPVLKFAFGRAAADGERYFAAR